MVDKLSDIGLVQNDWVVDPKALPPIFQVISVMLLFMRSLFTSVFGILWDTISQLYGTWGKMQSETPWFSRTNSMLCCVDLTPQYWHHVHVASILKTARNAYFIPSHCALKYTCAYVVTRYHRQLVVHNWCLTRNLLPSNWSKTVL